MSVALRMALERDPDVALATIATAATALGVALVAAAAEAPSRGLDLGSAWPFLLAGLLSPGAAQILVTIAIRESGASRVSMVFGTAPLVSGGDRARLPRRARPDVAAGRSGASSSPVEWSSPASASAPRT